MLSTGLYKYAQPLIVTPEPLPETGGTVLISVQSNGQPASQLAGHTDLLMEVAPQPKNEVFATPDLCLFLLLAISSVVNALFFRSESSFRSHKS